MTTKNKTENASEQEKMIEYYKQLNERQLADNQKLAEENERLHKKLQEPAESDSGLVNQLKSELESLKKREKSMGEQLHDEIKKWKGKLNLARETNEGMLREHQILTDEKKKLEEKLSIQKYNHAEYERLEGENHELVDRIQQLKQIECDYQSLEVLHENLKSEFNTFRARYHSIENDLEEFKDTEKMLVSTMNRYVKLYARVDEVTG